jgi:cation diffusion facilitator CzcD-associated flavoprotein CzcO
VSERPVVVIGAGPYGLAAAAHLREAGLDTHVFGRPMEFWREQMPTGMFLRSAWEASSIGDPSGRLTLDVYRDECAPGLREPVPIGDFIRYADWFREHAVQEIDDRRVERVERDGDGFRLVLDDGSDFEAGRVIVAVGLASFVTRPPLFDGFPAELASHSSEYTDFDAFAGKRVLVTGGGQSALESAALLAEAGADVEVLVRAPVVHWLPTKKLASGRAAPLRRHLYRPVIHRMLYAPTDVGPPGLNWLVAVPHVFRRFPRRLQTPIARRCIRPAGAAWLPDRLENVDILVDRSVVEASRNGHVQVRLSDGSEREVDHVLLATGFRVDVRGYPFLPAELLSKLETRVGHPVLRRGFESSVHGLHFLGAPSAWSFGPIMRFVCGTRFTGAELTEVMPELVAADSRAGPRRSRQADADALRTV